MRPTLHHGRPSFTALIKMVLVLPLVIVLIAVSSQSTLNRLAHRNLYHKEWVRLGSAAAWWLWVS